MTGTTTYPERLAIRITGHPVTQGNHRTSRYGRSFETTKGHKEWRALVTAEAEDQTAYADTITTPVQVWLRFTFKRPKAHFRTGRNQHLVRLTAPAYPKPDVDKLTRAVLDSLTKAKVYTDDSLVVDVRARKFWAGEHQLARPDTEGVDIIIEPLVVGR